MLWKSLLDWTRQLLRLKEATEKNTATLKEHQDAIEDVTDTAQRLVYEIAVLKQTQEVQQANLALRLENILLRERSLPPGASTADAKTEELMRLVDELKRENETLRQRLEQQTS